MWAILFILFVFVFILVMSIGYFISIYNMLVRVKNNVDKSWANIGVVLKQRHDVIEKLVGTCKAYMKYERKTLDEVIAARNESQTAQDKGDVDTLSKAESSIGATAKQLFALAENYPDLKANTQFQTLQNQVASLEDSIADRRELYNESCTVNNTKIEEFPACLFARILGFKHRTLLEFQESDDMKLIDSLEDDL